MITDNDILAYLEGYASEELRVEVEKWLSQSEQNRDEFEFAKMMWEETAPSADYVKFDVDEEWENFEAKYASGNEQQEDDLFANISRISVETEEEEEDPKEPSVPIEKEETKIVPIRRTNGRTIMAIAASFLVLIAATWWFWPQPKYIEIVNAESDMEIELDDGSIARISQGSDFKTLRSYKFAEDRIVNLSGEVNLDVASDPDKPFIVETTNTGVRVLGTRFNVIADGEESEVANEEGRVRFYLREDESTYFDLDPGDRMKYDGENFIDLNEPPPPPPPPPPPTIGDIQNYLERISRGNVVFGSEMFSYEMERLDIDFEGKSVNEVIEALEKVAIVVKLPKGCPSCWEITEIKPRRSSK